MSTCGMVRLMEIVYHPGFGQALRYDTQITSDDPDEQVADTIALMSRYVREDYRTPEIQADAEAAAPPGTDPLAGVFDWVRRRVRFRRDEDLALPLTGLQHPVAEVLIRPRDMATLCDRGECVRAGDCDDFAMYAAALLKAKGIPVSFVTLAADAADPGRFSHVYLAAYPPEGGRVAFDASHGAYVGWEAPDLYGRKQEWPVERNYWPYVVLALLVGALAQYGLKRRRN